MRYGTVPSVSVVTCRVLGMLNWKNYGSDFDSKYWLVKDAWIVYSWVDKLFYFSRAYVVNVYAGLRDQESSMINLMHSIVVCSFYSFLVL